MALEIRYLGWTAFELITSQGTRILLDPMLSGSEKDGIPPSPVQTHELLDINILMISHAAADHVGQAMEILRDSSAILVCDPATRFLAESHGIPENRIYRMVSGVLFKFDDVAVKALPAQHISLARTDAGFAGGQPLSFIIETEDGEKVFFAGDTSIHGDLKLYGELYHPIIGILGVGGVNVHGQSMTELHPDEAVLAAKWLGLEAAIPMHYRGNEGKDFVDELQKLAPNIEGILMQPGDRYVYPPGCESRPLVY